MCEKPADRHLRQTSFRKKARTTFERESPLFSFSQRGCAPRGKSFFSLSGRNAARRGDGVFPQHKTGGYLHKGVPSPAPLSQSTKGERKTESHRRACFLRLGRERAAVYEDDRVKGADDVEKHGLGTAVDEAVVGRDDHECDAHRHDLGERPVVRRERERDVQSRGRSFGGVSEIVSRSSRASGESQGDRDALFFKLHRSSTQPPQVQSSTKSNRWTPPAAAAQVPP